MTYHDTQVQGNLAAACQASPSGECVAVCIEGGPVTRIEHLLMDEIVKGVHVRGKVAKVTVKRLTFDALRAEIAASYAGPVRFKRQPLAGKELS